MYEKYNMLAGGRATIQRQESSAKHTGGKSFPHFTVKRVLCRQTYYTES